MMKKKLFFLLLIFGLGLTCLLARNSSVHAQGTCECEPAGGGGYKVKDGGNNCDLGYNPHCGALGSCSCGLPPTPASPPSGGGPIHTAIGDIDVDSPEVFVNKILEIAIGIAGGIAILLILYGAFLTLTSSGNPEKVQAGKELITSAITGLLVVIFAVFLLRLIGKDVLEIFQ